MIQSLKPYLSTVILAPGRGAWVRGEEEESLTLSPPAPTIAAFSVASGPISGGTSVIITGAAFMGVTEVSFGGVLPTSNYSVDSDIQITVPSVPAHAAGTISVSVTTASGPSSDTSADDYTYVDNTGTIAVSDFPNYRVFQRDIGGTSR